MHATPVILLVAGAASVGLVHSILPDHWVPLAVVARTQRWSTARLARTTFLAAGGHVLASIALGGIIALIGLQFQKQIEAEQGHIVGGVLVITGLGFLAWGLTGHGRAHEHGPPRRESDGDQQHAHEPERESNDEAHEHAHEPAVTPANSGDHLHEHQHGGVRHSHRHHHEVFVQKRAALIAERSERKTVLGRLAAVTVPFGIAASPDLTFLPIAIAASAYGATTVGAVLGVFAAVTMAAFVGLTTVATAVGYQMHGEWLEANANTITSLVLIAIGLVAYVGF